MSLLGFVITGIIFLSVFDAKFTECICGCKCEEKVEVCKGDSVVLKPSAIRITDTIKSVKLIRSRTDCQGKIKGNSPLIRLSNIGENDTGLYRFRGRGFDGGGPKIYCIQLKITCERLVVPSGSSVNLTCKVKNIDKLKEWRINGSSANSTSSRTLTLSQLNKSHSGNYTCIASKKDTSVTGIGQWKHYRFVLKVYEPQLIATTKSQKKHTSRFTLPTVVSVPTSITRNVTTPGFTTNKDTTKDEVTESVPNFTQLKTKEILDTTPKIEETVPPTKEDTVPPTKEDTVPPTKEDTVPPTKENSAAVRISKGEKEKRPNSIGTRVNCTFSVLVLSQLYIWIWKIYTTTK